MVHFSLVCVHGHAVRRYRQARSAIVRVVRVVDERLGTAVEYVFVAPELHVHLFGQDYFSPKRSNSAQTANACSG